MVTVLAINNTHQNTRKTKLNLLFNDLLNGFGILAKNWFTPIARSFIHTDYSKRYQRHKKLFYIFFTRFPSFCTLLPPLCAHHGDKEEAATAVDKGGGGVATTYA